MTCLLRMHELVATGSQFIIATHSPLILAYPQSTIYACSEAGLQRINHDDAEAVRLTRGFLDAPQRYLDQLLAPGGAA